MKILTKEQVLNKSFIQKTLKDYQKPIRGVDLFCGCGGFSLGFMEAGINVVCGVDNDYWPLATYYYNLCGPESVWINKQEPKRLKKSDVPSEHPIDWKKRFPNGISPIKAVIQKDINDVDADDILNAAGVDKVECVFGSPPCPSFSTANPKGVRKRGHPLDYLCFEFARLILELQPKCIAMENVPPFIKKKLPDGRLIIDVFTDILKNQDWELYYEIKYGRWWDEIHIKPPVVQRIQIHNDDLPEGIISVVDVR